ncbi:MAG: hypothetical protein LUF90_04255 [Rikenellaceae bacterium]|nr:hypothetical protein [Rikenellaceae bacterium]
MVDEFLKLNYIKYEIQIFVDKNKNWKNGLEKYNLIENREYGYISTEKNYKKSRIIPVVLKNRCVNENLNVRRFRLILNGDSLFLFPDSLAKCATLIMRNGENNVRSITGFCEYEFDRNNFFSFFINIRNNFHILYSLSDSCSEQAFTVVKKDKNSGKKTVIPEYLFYRKLQSNMKNFLLEFKNGMSEIIGLLISLIVYISCGMSIFFPSEKNVYILLSVTGLISYWTFSLSALFINEYFISGGKKTVKKMLTNMIWTFPEMIISIIILPFVWLYGLLMIKKGKSEGSLC